MCLLDILVSFLGIDHTWPYMAECFLTSTYFYTSTVGSFVRMSMLLFLCRHDSPCSSFLS